MDTIIQYIIYIKNRGNEQSGYGFGMFGVSDKSIEIRNLNMSLVSINSSYGEVGALVGTIEGRGGRVVIENCVVDGVIKSEGYRVGGIIGSSWTENIMMRNCKNYCDVYGEQELVGGIIGQAASTGSFIEESINYGNVTGSIYAVGGIIGEYTPRQETKSYIKNCVNYADIHIKDEDDIEFECLGGIVGYAGEGEIYNCINYGNLINNKLKITNVGGIIGEMQWITLNRCINYGNIILENGTNVGGLVGMGNDIDETEKIGIENCYNIGNVKGKENVGGITGINGYIHNIFGSYKGTIKNCYNIGQVTGTTNTGGIAGLTITEAGSTIEDSYYLSTTSGIGYTKDTGETSTEGAKTETEMKQDSFVDVLNQNNEEVIWMKDEENENNGYPILRK